jgi:hypothetical protein
LADQPNILNSFTLRAKESGPRMRAKSKNHQLAILFQEKNLEEMPLQKLKPAYFAQNLLGKQMYPKQAATSSKQPLCNLIHWKQFTKTKSIKQSLWSEFLLHLHLLIVQNDVCKGN